MPVGFPPALSFRRGDLNFISLFCLLSFCLSSYKNTENHQTHVFWYRLRRLPAINRKYTLRECKKTFSASGKIISPSGNRLRRPGKLFERPETIKRHEKHNKNIKKTFLWPPPAGAVLYDGRQNERSIELYKKRKINRNLLHGARETGLPRPGVLCVGYLSWVRSIMQVRRCVGENDRTGSEKSTQKSGFEHNFDTFSFYFKKTSRASREDKLKEHDYIFRCNRSHATRQFIRSFITCLLYFHTKKSALGASRRGRPKNNTKNKENNDF